MPRKYEQCYDRLSQTLFEESAFAQAAADSLCINRDGLKNAPLRVRLILKGLVSGSSVLQVNQVLQNHGLPLLYARSFSEAVLMYSLDKKLSLKQWLELQAQCDTLRQQAIDRTWFQEGKITLQGLEQYVKKNSQKDDTALRTGRLTERIAADIGMLQTDEALFTYLNENLMFFSGVREKTRYYFCKYLCYFLQSRIDDFWSATSAGIGTALAAEQIKILFRTWTYLDRHRRLNYDETINRFKQSAVSLSGVFEEFNFFFFGYTTQQWTELLLETFDNNPATIPGYLKEKYARVKKLKYSKDIDRLLLHMAETREEELDFAAKERCGETALRKYLHGQLDLDRTTFLCFLMFFSRNAQLPAEQLITEDRANTILSNCGFLKLQQDDDFDGFVNELLLCKDQAAIWELVSNEIASCTQKGENSFLYRTYRQSVNYQKQLTQIFDTFYE